MERDSAGAGAVRAVRVVRAVGGQVARLVMLGQQQNTILLYLFERSFLSCLWAVRAVGMEACGWWGRWV